MTLIMKQKEATRSGAKTETRRVVKPGETWDAERQAVLLPSGRVKWRVGGEYSVVPKMYGKTFGRIRITAIEHQQLHEIDDAGSLREGILAVPFSMTVTESYCNEVQVKNYWPTPRMAYEALWEYINGKSKKYRWRANPSVWVLRYEYLGDVADDPR